MPSPHLAVPVSFSDFPAMAQAVLTSPAAQAVFAHTQHLLTPLLVEAGFEVQASHDLPAWRPVGIVGIDDKFVAATSLTAYDPVTRTPFRITARLSLEQTPGKITIFSTVKATHSEPAQICAKLPNAGAFWQTTSLDIDYAKACEDLVENRLYLPPAKTFAAMVRTLSGALMP